MWLLPAWTRQGHEKEKPHHASKNYERCQDLHSS